MDDLKWIQEITSKKIVILKLLKRVDETMPSNFNNDYFNRKYIVDSYIEELVVLNNTFLKYEKDCFNNKEYMGTVEFKVLCRLVTRLKKLSSLINGIGPHGTKNPFNKRYTHKKIKGFKKAISEMIDDIMGCDDSWWYWEKNNGFL